MPPALLRTLLPPVDHTSFTWRWCQSDDLWPKAQLPLRKIYTLCLTEAQSSPDPEDGKGRITWKGNEMSIKFSFRCHSEMGLRIGRDGMVKGFHFKSLLPQAVWDLQGYLKARNALPALEILTKVQSRPQDPCSYQHLKTQKGPKLHWEPGQLATIQGFLVPTPHGSGPQFFHRLGVDGHFHHDLYQSPPCPVLIRLYLYASESVRDLYIPKHAQPHPLGFYLHFTVTVSLVVLESIHPLYGKNN